MRLLTILSLAGLLIACSSLQTNPTVFPYKINQAQLNTKPVKTVVIAPFSLGGQGPAWMEAGKPQVNRQLTAYLQKHGITVLSPDSLSTAWRNATRLFGSPWDPSTNRVNRETLVRCLRYSLQESQKTTPVDAVVIMDLIERPVFFEPAGDHRARWDGVTRFPTLVGPDNYVSMDFNWNQAVQAFSIAINIYDPSFNLLFQSVGGIDLSQDYSTRTGSTGYVRREKPFRYTSHIDEGIALSLHPFITMKHYPAPKAQ